MVGAMVASALGFLAVLLALAGIYSVVAYAVSLRTREIGIRMALGAQRLDVFKLVLRRACSLVAIGVVLGLAGSIPAAHVLAAAIAGDAGSPDLLFGLNALDPVTFGAVSALLVAAALLASYIPGRRATKVDPVVALRYE